MRTEYVAAFIQGEITVDLSKLFWAVSVKGMNLDVALVSREDASVIAERYPELKKLATGPTLMAYTSGSGWSIPLLELRREREHAGNRQADQNGGPIIDPNTDE